VSNEHKKTTFEKKKRIDMRNLTILLFALVIISCGNQKKLVGEEQTSVSIYHQWKLTNIEGETVDTESMPKLVQITFNKEENRFFGSDGCNQISGGFEISENDLKFGPSMGTKMACMDMHIPDLFGQTLSKVSTFKTKELKNGEVLKTTLELLDKDGQILMLFEMAE
jgi:heat shock protein HslJ